jgi:hypothetical protein
MSWCRSQKVLVEESKVLITESKTLARESKVPITKSKIRSRLKWGVGWAGPVSGKIKTN